MCVCIIGSVRESACVFLGVRVCEYVSEREGERERAREGVCYLR